MKSRRAINKVRLGHQVVLRFREATHRDRKKEQNRYACRMWKKNPGKMIEEEGW